MCTQTQLINSQVSLQNTGFQYNFQSTFTLYSLTYNNIKLILNLKIMKKILTLLSILMIVLVVMGISSCKKSDPTPIELPPNNVITISGNTTTANNKTYIPDPLNCFYMAANPGCVPITYHSYISIGLATHESFYFYITSASSDVIPTGTINITNDPCLAGFYGGFIPALKKVGSNLYFSSGTITITKNGVNYSVDFDLTIFPENGGGKITGNFNGPLIEQLPPK